MKKPSLKKPSALKKAVAVRKKIAPKKTLTKRKKTRKKNQKITALSFAISAVFLIISIIAFRRKRPMIAIIFMVLAVLNVASPLMVPSYMELAQQLFSIVAIITSVIAQACFAITNLLSPRLAKKLI
jgi:ABC-type uncharacterized transport system permease subunit